MLDYQDSNLEKQDQNLLCYHYTIVQFMQNTTPPEPPLQLGYQDSNLEKQDQNLLCYHYTIAHCPFCDCKFSDLFLNPQIFTPFFREACEITF